jgi:hypothetical protein
MIVFFLSLLGPRVALGAVWFFTGFVDRTFDSNVAPVLGFLFVPWTTLTYVLWHDGSGVSGFGWLFVALGFLADVSSYGAASRRGRRGGMR